MTPQGGADGGGVGVLPVKGKGAALVRLDGVDAAAVRVVKPHAGTVRAAAQDQPRAVGREFGFAVDEILLGSSQKGGDARDLPGPDADDSVLDATAGAAPEAGEGWQLAVRGTKKD